MNNINNNLFHTESFNKVMNNDLTDYELRTNEIISELHSIAIEYVDNIYDSLFSFHSLVGEQRLSETI